MGEDITWITPHPFTQTFPEEIDVNVMNTFMEFYEVFLRFVLLKLYHTLGLKYPPVVDESKDSSGCLLLALRAAPIESDGLTDKAVTTAANGSSRVSEEGNLNNEKKKKDKTKVLNSVARLVTLEDKMASIVAKDEEENDEEALIGAPLAEAFSLVGLDAMGERETDMDEGEKKTFAISDQESLSHLFTGLKFFINVEVPLDWLQLCVLSFGGLVGWDGEGSSFKSEDPSITHHVIDRPLQVPPEASREYVQPQWVFDSINAALLLPTLRYRPGSSLPPHLSPFVDDAREGYLPAYREELSKLKSVAEVVAANGQIEEEEEEEEEYEKGVKAEREGTKYSSERERERKGREKETLEEEDVEEIESDAEEEEREKEKEKEASKSSVKGPKAVVYAPDGAVVTEDKDDTELSHIMMSKKTKRLYSRMQHGLEKKKAVTDRLLDKRREIDQNIEIESVMKGKKRNSETIEKKTLKKKKKQLVV
eukprot:CAMPEP_0182421878 /NCGR_PEP_ID=MMETSP1167-20130531/7421_1 /TAXON_ID=2988 /ORGANISM="Mallomonas Sp, Strain CCMP3275" /LENGTH=479 /DNA_ID=CAMNT_0024599459 /DNA_START=703 /DNA_END=2142 /DNA_ORIENTATION=-